MVIKIQGNAKIQGKTILGTVIPTYAIERSLSAVNEGSSVTFTLSTTNVANGTLVPYTISGISSNDVTTGSLTGSFTVNSGLATTTITMLADVLTEGTETATLTLNNAAASNFVVVNDTSTIDSDALAYVNAVQTADGASLENSVRLAINNFVVGCKSDGIWSAIKASCILAGARSLNGALVPLVGTAPTNFNFVSADYNRKTGLQGNGSTKYLNTNVAGNSSLLPQDNAHFSIYASVGPTSSATGVYMGNASIATTGGTGMFRGAGSGLGFDTNLQNSGSPASFRQTLTNNLGDWAGFRGVKRASAVGMETRRNSQSFSFTNASASRLAANIMIFRMGNTSNYGNGQYSFYSLGESLDLALLDTRVTNLMTALAAAI